MNKLAAALGVALILAGSSAVAMASDTQLGPIRIENVQLFAGTHSADYNRPGYASIAFTNDNGSPATDVVFALEADGRIVEHFDDVGFFAPGVSIEHNFQVGSDYNNITVAVAKATFANGTVWDNPDVPSVAAAPALVGVSATAQY